MPVYAYTRCSHRKSEESGAGLAAQDTRVAELFADAAELDPSLKWARDSFDNERPGHFTDKAVSAFKIPIFKRPAGSELMGKLKKGDLLLVSAVDRMFRSVTDMANTMQWFEKKGVRVQFGNAPLDTSTPLGRMFLQQMVCFAEWESAIKGQRLREAAAIRAAAKEAGKPVDPSLIMPSVRSRLIQDLAKRKDKPPQFDPALLEIINGEDEPKPKEMPPGRIFISIRCSHLDSVESGLGLEWQRQTCMRRMEQLRAKYPQLTFGGEFVDEAVSAWKHRLEKRPEAGRMAAMLKPGDHVLFARLDRAFRSVRDMADTLPRWQEKGVSVCFVSDGVDSTTVWGRAAIGMLSIFAQLEPELTSSRTKEALRELRSRGRGLSGMWGFVWKEIDGQQVLVPCRKTLAKIRLAYWLYNHCKLSMEKVCKRIEELTAKREGRRPLPMSGVSPVHYHSSKWFGVGVDGFKIQAKPHRHPTTGKMMERLIVPAFHINHVKIARKRWPLLAQYREQKRREAREARESRRLQESAESSAL